MEPSDDKQAISEIYSKLKKEAGIEIDQETFRKLTVQGFNSKVYTARTDKEIIIHILNPVKEQIRQAISKKLVGVSKLIQEVPGIPVARFFYEGTLEDGRFIFVQEKLPGKNWGRRKIENGKIVDEFFTSGNEEYFTQLNKILATLHTIKFSRYGYLKQEGENLDGDYKSWGDFLLTESDLWFENIWQNRERGYELSEKALLDVKNKLSFICYRNKHLFESGAPSLIHGDMINPGNILIEESRISGIIDFEWSLAGDAAWEFAYSGNPGMDNFFDVCDEMGVSYDRDLFREKVKFYRIFWLIWGTNVHAEGYELKKLLFEDLVESLNNYCNQDSI
ncbi:MAG TPA: hypothetical protein DIC35_04875 [Candidatus Moranbacteria bacterium]|nr:hypothetical protein [Candidatus Moranbacteria bacterium]